MAARHEGSTVGSTARLVRCPLAFQGAPRTLLPRGLPCMIPAPTRFRCGARKKWEAKPSYGVFEFKAFRINPFKLWWEIDNLL
jgi:hypothetical protein